MAFFVTFYSYKGGVGRTLALANVAYALAARGKKVVTLDLDLEAPGLSGLPEFQIEGRDEKPGFLEYAEYFRREGECDSVEEYVHLCQEFEEEHGKLWLMPPGLPDDSYQRLLSGIDWRRIHDTEGTGPFVEGLREALENELKPDYVLIDARTGLSDIGGLSTNLMSDFVVLVFNLTEGCIDGSADVCRTFLHPDSRPKFVQLVANPIPPPVEGEEGLIGRRLRRAEEKMADAVAFGREIVRIHYDPAMVLARELPVRDPEKYLAARKYEELREILQRANPNEVFSVLEEAREILRDESDPEGAIRALRGFTEKHPENVEGRLELGKLLLEENEAEEAVREFRNAVGFAPRFAEAHRRLGIALLEAGRPFEALESLDDANKHGDESKEYLLALARAAAEAEETARHVEAQSQYASRLFSESVAAGPGSDVNAEELHRQFVESLSLRPPMWAFDPQAYWDLLMGSLSMSTRQKFRFAERLLAGELTTSKIREMEKTIEDELRRFEAVLGEGVRGISRRIAFELVDPTDPEALLGLRSGGPEDVVLLRIAAARAQSVHDRVEYLEEARGLVPGSRHIWNELLHALAAAAESESDEYPWVEKASKLATIDLDLLEDKELELRTGRAWQRLISSAPDPCREELSERALVHIDRAIELGHDDGEAYFLRGWISHDLAERAADPKRKEELLQGARQNYSKSVELRPAAHPAFNNWGSTLVQLADLREESDQKAQLLEEACEKYRAALEIQPDKHEALYNWGVALSELSSLREAVGEKSALLEEACEKYRAALDVKPDKHEAFDNLAAALLEFSYLAPRGERRHFLENALEAAKQANEIAPGSADFNCACALSLLGRFDESARALVHVLLGAPEILAKNLDDRDLDNLWESYPELRRAVEDGLQDNSREPLEKWLEAHPEVAEGIQDLP